MAMRVEHNGRAPCACVRLASATRPLLLCPLPVSFVPFSFFLALLLLYIPAVHAHARVVLSDRTVRLRA